MDTVNAVVDDEMTPEMEQNLAGNDAGRAFAYRHIMDKINLFIQEYRRNGYGEDFVAGFIDGVNDVTGGSISLDMDSEEEDPATDDPEDLDS